MNDRRFIELLNLYVDQELTEKEARELEQEIARNAARRDVYGQYCRMQRACVKLFDQQAAPAPRVAAITRAAAAREPEMEREVVFRRTQVDDPVIQRRSSGWWGWGSGALAAAAAVALVVVQVNKPAASSGLSEAGAIAATVESPPPPVAVPATDRSDYRPVFVVNLRPTAAQLAQRGSALELPQPTFDWEQELKLRPLRRVPLESLQFTPRSITSPTFVNDPTDGPAAEMVTFTFQR